VIGGSLFIVLTMSFVARSEGLPIKTYTTADGLAFDRVNKIFKDSRGFLWFCTDEGLSRFDGYGFKIPDDFVQALLVDRDGRLWAGTRYDGLCVVSDDPDPSRVVVVRLYKKEDGLASDYITSVFQSSDGKLWVGTIGGLCELTQTTPITGMRSFLTYNTANGLSTDDLMALAEDSGGNLWLATRHGGAMKLANNGLTGLGPADGLGSGEIRSIFSDLAGHLCVATARLGSAADLINRFDGKRFKGVVPNLKGDVVSHAWVCSQLTFQGRDGEWWVPTRSGLFRFPKVSVDMLPLVRPKAAYTVGESDADKTILAIYQDSRGDVWLSTDSIKTPVACWEAVTDRVRSYQRTDGLPLSGMSHATSFREDRAGGLWIGFNNGGGLARYRNGQFRLFSNAEGLSSPSIAALYVDQSGRLWIAAGEGGLVRVDDPAADEPQFIRYTEGTGLSSDIVWCVTGDRRGRVFAGTGRGVDVLDPDTGAITHYGVADGLARGEVRLAFRDGQDALWFATSDRLSRLVPAVERPPISPPVFITRVRAGGRTLAVSELGEKRVAGLEFDPTENRVQIDFVGLGFAEGESLRYKYRLDGADSDWSIPGEIKTVSYPSLRPGKYRFEVLAVSTNGALSESPAPIAFEILPPIWQRWWFLTPAAMLLALLIYRLYRYRIARLVELERVRTRIATDLHDDIGSSLSRMAILSEVVKQRMGSAACDSQELLTEIAESGRRLVDAMSDIVWSIDPRRDDLSNLASRVREFAAGLLDTRPIKWSFQIPPEMDHLRLGPDERRQVFLIMKEAITNAARHSRCGMVSMSMSISQNKLLAEVSDDGCGFSLGSPRNGGGGQGLGSMRSRAAQLGGELSVTSAPGKGTCLRVEVPIRGRMRRHQ
jgi:signal transduction histidine kinase/ligand-binding sensor domain-containing protein